MTGLAKLGQRAIVLACAAFVAAGLSACSSSGQGFFERLGELTLTSIAEPKETPPSELTRAELEKIPYATIAVSSDGGPRAYLVPQVDNGGYLDYRDEDGNSVRIFGGAVSGLETAGRDLEGVRYDKRDPIAHLTPIASWPSELWREYQFVGPDLRRYVVALKCNYELVGRVTIEIVEIRFDLMRVRERCANARRQVVNNYWVDEVTGFIWKSQQWLGPRIGHITVEIIRPYAG
jgi:hypothetical protein